jgi:thioredoxin 1
MKSWHRYVIGLVGLMAGVLMVRQPVPVLAVPAPTQGKPALYEFGAGYCVSCREMAKIMAELKPQFAGQLEVRMVYADKEKDLFQQYKIMLIPTQVFLDAAGHEVDRHIGPLSKEEVITKLKELKFIH